MSSTFIQYHGDLRTTQSCIDAGLRLLQCAEQVDQVLLLTSGTCHAFLFTLHGYQKIIVQCGFTSGYSGEGPKGLATMIQLIRFHRVEIEEVIVSKRVFGRIQNARLTLDDLREIESSDPVLPYRIGDYIYEVGELPESVLKSLHSRRIPWPIIDDRILDLASRLDHGDSSVVLEGFKRLEGILQDRAGLKNKPFREAVMKIFRSGKDNSHPSAAEKLMTSIYTLYRNERAHREKVYTREEQLRSFLMLNELFVLEQEHAGE